MTAQASLAATTAPEKTESLLQRLWALHPKAIDLSLERIERLLDALGNPEGQLPPVVHVAGTNGKGSVIAFLRAFLEAAGTRVHVYTSPHLVRVNERYCLAGRLIGDAELVAYLEECEAANGGAPITFFEITTAAAFLAFSRVPADVVLLETGLGGKLDATNTVARPAVTAITPVSVDHVQFLGETLAEIAGEKAGILKPGVAAVIGPQDPEAAEAIAARAEVVGAPLIRYGTDWQAHPVGAGMTWRRRDTTLELPAPALFGAHQVDNAGLAIACLERLPGLTVDEAAIRRGLATVEWPGRLQLLEVGPLVDGLPGDGWELWLDGGHNPAAGRMLATVARGWRDRPLHLIFGILSSKDGTGFLSPLAPFAESVRAVAIPGEQASLSADEAAEVARAAGLAAEPAESIDDAVKAIVAGSSGPARVLICGSLYLAGKVLATNGARLDPGRGVPRADTKNPAAGRGWSSEPVVSGEERPAQRTDSTHS
jgi:dihydrofolate synthase/folylpolyglutamate synthase